MTILPENIKQQIPKLYTTRDQTDPKVVCKFFDPVGITTWFVLEGEELPFGNFLFYGFVISRENSFSYFTLFQLLRMKDGIPGLRGLPIERDRYFKPCRLSQLFAH